MQIHKCQSFEVQLSKLGYLHCLVRDNINLPFIVFYVIITAIQLCLREGPFLGFVSV